MSFDPKNLTFAEPLNLELVPELPPKKIKRGAFSASYQQLLVKE
jgi:hypothetical protein